MWGHGTRKQETEVASKWTYHRNIAAWLGSEIVTIPDQIMDNQREINRQRISFPGKTAAGTIRLRLDGEGYELITGGMLVVRA